MSYYSNRLRERMEELNLSQADLSRLTGITKSAISQYLSGKCKPGIGKSNRIAEALGVSQSFLTGEKPEVVVISNKKNMSIDVAAELMGKSKQFIRLGLQRGEFSFGTAIKMSSKYTYYISPSKFYEYIGVDND